MNWVFAPQTLIMAGIAGWSQEHFAEAKYRELMPRNMQHAWCVTGIRRSKDNFYSFF